MSARSFRFAGALAAGVALSGCHHRGNTVQSDTSAVQGTVSVTGTAFEQQLMLKAGTRSIRLHATAPDSVALVRLGGAEIVVHGAESAAGLQVKSFAAVRVANVAVVDGVIREDQGKLVLETVNGRIALGNPPTALRQMIGARVWISGPLDKGPNSYGVIVPR